MRIELIDTVERLKAIKKQWLDLMPRSTADDFFLLPQWFTAWWSAFHHDKALFFFTVWRQGQLCGLFPLVKIRRGPFRVIAFAGLPRAGRMDFLLADDCRTESLEAFIHWLFSRTDWDLLSLRAFGPFSGNPQKMGHLLSENEKPHTLTKEVVSYYIPTGDYDDFDHYLKDTRGSRTRKAFRRKRRKLISERGAQWEITGAPSNALVDEMADLDSRRSQRGHNRRSFFSDAGNTAFLKSLISELADEDRIRTVCLRMNGRLFAFDLLFLYAGNVLSYQTAFDRSLYAFGAGNLTLLDSLQFAFGNKMKTYDFLSGDDSYKSEWADQYHQNWRLQVYGKGIRATMLFFYHRIIKPLRRRIKQIPAVQKLLPRKFRSTWDI